MTTDVSDQRDEQDEQSEQPDLSLRLVAYYREVLKTHVNDPVLRACVVCKVSKCQDWRFAYERLVCAGVRLDGTEASGLRGWRRVGGDE